MASDKNFESYAQQDGTLIEDRVFAPENIDQYSDILKFSNCTNTTVNKCRIEGGKEDAIDAVRGSNYTISSTTLVPKHNGITLKGSIDGYIIQDVTFETHGKDCDIDIGQYDNYYFIGRKPTRHGNITNVNADDGKPVVIRLWDATKPNIFNSNVKVVTIPKLIWWPYFVFRAIQTRGIKNIFKPVDGNSFIKTK
jgi:hypothetical protein